MIKVTHGKVTKRHAPLQVAELVNDGIPVQPPKAWLQMALDQMQELSHIKPRPQTLMPTGTKMGTGHMGTMVNGKGDTTAQLLPNVNLLKKKQTSGFYVPSPDFLILATNSLCLKKN